jgi:hypothetical protein
MAKFVTNNAVVVIGGSTVTASCASATISLEADDIETTAFDNAGYRTRVGGLKSGTVDFEFHQDFAVGSIDSLFFPLLGGTTSVAIRPAGTGIGTASPEYQFSVMVQQYNPMDSAVGDLATVSLSFPITGPVTRATA